MASAGCSPKAKLDLKTIRFLHNSSRLLKMNEPLSGAEMIRAGGIASMMRLPVQKETEGLDACFVGVPLDQGTTNRSGTRFGPRQIRTESVILRRFNNATRASPFDTLMVADVGDVNFNQYNLPEAVKQIKEQFSKLISTGCKTLAMGGDHTISYPILQAVKEKYGKVGLIHVDAHTDVYGPYTGAKIHHGNPFLLAVEEDLLDCSRVIQIGLRGPGYGDDWAASRKLVYDIYKNDRLVGTKGGVAICAANPYTFRPCHEKEGIRRENTIQQLCTANRKVLMVMDSSQKLFLKLSLSVWQEQYGPVGLIHVDAHTDTYGPFLGTKIHHGNSFLLAVEEGCLDCERVVQIGLRGSGLGDDWDMPRKLGFRTIPAHECWHKSLTPLMEEVRQMMGSGPVYISFDIDSLDPSFAPGTGTPEIGGLTIIHALEIIRGCKGLNVVGTDLVEVSPPYDKDGTTALTGANLLFEMLCILPGVNYLD